MFGSVVLEVGIGLTFFYLLLSVMCSAIHEWIAGILTLRGRNLWQGISNLLHDEDSTAACDRLFAHPLIKSLAKPSRVHLFRKTTQRRPSYIPPNLFASALLDLLSDQDRGIDRPFDDIQGLIEEINEDSWVSPDLKKTLTVFVNETGDDLGRFRMRIEQWYGDCMDRVSGWYKRRAQAVIFGIALSITCALNADTITIVNTLWNDSDLRTQLSVLAGKATEHLGKDDLTKDSLEILQPMVRLNQFPVGWDFNTKFSDTEPRGIPSGQDWFAKIVGLLVTTFSVSLGAPFWFDLLSKLIRVRSSIQAEGNGRSQKAAQSSK